MPMTWRRYHAEIMAVKVFGTKAAFPAPDSSGNKQFFYVFDTLAELANGHDAGDLAVVVDTAQIMVWNGTAWREHGGGLSGTTTLTDNTATSMFTVTCPATTGTVVAGFIEYVVKFVDDEATDVVQTEAGITPFAVLNESGTVTAVLMPSGLTLTGPAATDIVADVGGSTNAVSFTASVASLVATFKCTSNTGLTPAGGDTHSVSWRVRLITGTGAAATLA